MTDKLAKPIKPPGSNSLSARLQSHRSTQNTDVNSFPNRLALVFDDSISMAGSTIEDAKKGVEAFLQTINPNDTAVAIYPLNANKQPLVNNIGQLFAYTMGIKVNGGTPIFKILSDILSDAKCTRVILFSDGEPTDRYDSNWEASTSTSVDKLTTESVKFKEKNIPIDTVYIGGGESEFLKKLAELTGGIYLHFTDSSVFGKNLKYLAPKFRALLSDGKIREQVQKGEL